MNKFNLMSETEKWEYLKSRRLSDEEVITRYPKLEERLKPEMVEYILRKKKSLQDQRDH